MAPIGNIDLSKYNIYGGTNSTAVASGYTPRFGSVSGTESRVLNPEAFKGVVSEAVSRKGITPTRETEAVAGAQSFTPATQHTAQPVSIDTVKQVFSAKPSYKAADAYRGIAAENAYAKAGKNSYDTSVYDGLKSFKSSEVKQNPFTAAFAGNGSDYTSGLSFGGIKNLDPDKSMFIA